MSQNRLEISRMRRFNHKEYFPPADVMKMYLRHACKRSPLYFFFGRSHITTRVDWESIETFAKVEGFPQARRYPITKQSHL